MFSVCVSLRTVFTVAAYACFALALNTTNASGCKRWYLKTGPWKVGFFVQISKVQVVLS